MTPPLPNTGELVAPSLRPDEASLGVTLRRRSLSALHLGCLGLVTLVILTPVAIVATAIRPFAPRWRDRLGSAALYIASAALVRMIGWRIETHGPAPTARRGGGVLIAANHTTYMDALMLSALLPARFVGKSEIGGWPVIGRIATAIGTFFLRRFDRAHVRAMKDEVAGALRAGDAVILFPEATTSDGRRLLPFNPALLEAAVEAGVPVLPVAIHYTAEGETRPLHEIIAWWRPVAFGAHLARLFSVRPVVATLAFGEPLLPPPPAAGGDAAPSARAARKEIARTARAAVAARLAGMTDWNAEELMRRGDAPEWAPSADRSQLEPAD